MGQHMKNAATTTTAPTTTTAAAATTTKAQYFSFGAILSFDSLHKVTSKQQHTCHTYTTKYQPRTPNLIEPVGCPVMWFPETTVLPTSQIRAIMLVLTAIN